VKDIVHVNAIISFAAVSLEVKFTEFLLFIRHHMLMFKFALLPLRVEKMKTFHLVKDLLQLF